MAVARSREVKIIRRRITANGTWNYQIGYPVGRMALTVKGVGSAATAWKVEVKGRPAATDSGTAISSTTTVIDDHTSGVEADGATVQSTNAGVLTNVDVVMSTINLGSASAIDVEIVICDY